MNRTGILLGAVAIAGVSFVAGLAVGRSSSESTTQKEPPAAASAVKKPTPAADAAQAPDPAEKAHQQMVAEAKRIKGLRGAALFEELEAWEEKADDVTYAMLERNAEANAGKLVAYRGQVLEIHDTDDGGAVMRVGIKPSYGYWSDPIWVDCLVRPDPSVVERSKVRIYGGITGSYSYTSQAGWNITIPRMLAKIVVPEKVYRQARLAGRRAARREARQ